MFYLKLVAYLRLTLDRSQVYRDVFVCCQVRANEIYAEAIGQFSARSRDVLMKQFRDSVYLPSPCHPCPSLTTFAFRLSEVRRLLLELDSCGGRLPFGHVSYF